jgi:myo-inositol catabolism protein IolS
MGIGTWQASSDWNRNDKEILDAIVESNRLGLNLIDTAEEYGHGRSEKVVGEAIRILGRDNVVVATKVNPPHLRYHDVLKACDASLTRLGIETAIASLRLEYFP